MTAICERCKSEAATLAMVNIRSEVGSPAELVCVNCCYAQVSRDELGHWRVGYLKGAANVAQEPI